MQEFETFAYLDVQKTGSSFIRDFFRQFCKEKEIRSAQHAEILGDHPQNKMYFISVRDPLSQYLSLYSYGCEFIGQLFTQLHKKGISDLYNGTWTGFETWLEFVLRPENARLLGQGYGKSQARTVSRLVGFQSYRVLLLALPDARKLLERCGTREEIAQTYHEKKLFDYVVHTEALRSDLIRLVETRLRGSMTDVTAALNHLRTEPPRNPSDRIDRYEINPRLNSKLRARLEEREWLLYEEFGYASGLNRKVSAASSIPRSGATEESDLETRVHLAELRAIHAETELRFISTMARWRELKVDMKGERKRKRKQRGGKKAIQQKRRLVLGSDSAGIQRARAPSAETGR